MRQNDDDLDATGSAPDPAQPPARDPDWDLVRRVGAGDRAAFDALYRRYFTYLHRFVLQTTRRADVVDEVINEVMYAVWRQAARARPRARVATWIMSIAYNKSVDALRRAGTGTQFVALDADDPELAGGVEPADRAAEADNLLEAALARLPAEQRAVMELVYHQGLHYAEIARVLGCPENTVKTRVFHARRKLRELWSTLAGDDR